ncbi:hypothetical protein ACNKHK_19505 [Shigella flexneri]
MLYAHASRILHHETNSWLRACADAESGQSLHLIDRPFRCLAEGMDPVALPYKRVPHPAYGDAAFPPMR